MWEQTGSVLGEEGEGGGGRREGQVGNMTASLLNQQGVDSRGRDLE